MFFWTISKLCRKCFHRKQNIWEFVLFALKRIPVRQECNIFQRVLHLHGNLDNLIYYESDPLLFGVVYNYTYLANNFEINVSRYFELIL